MLDIDGLTLELPATARPLLSDVSLRVRMGEVVGLVGESGSGKSTTAKAALGMLPEGGVTTGAVRVEGTDALALRGEKLRAHRARTVAMVHQDPRAALNPVRRVGDFLTERLALAGVTDRRAARARAVELLDTVGLPDPARRVRQHPHELSGGMLQRVVIAGALAAEPRLLLADEATSALDVTTQAEILDLLRTLRAERETGMLFITHDLHLAAAYCDRVVVMYAGRVAEHQSARALFAAPRHPYTRGLLDCSPALGEEDAVIRPIPGRPPSLADSFPGCPFAARCPEAEPECETWTPVATPLEPDAVSGDEGGPGEEGGEASCRRLPESAPGPASASGSAPASVPVPGSASGAVSGAVSGSASGSASVTVPAEGSTR
ncbi:ABC transporter ATP-binding protein [Streptomyces iconiensis]|uniref:ABC transporter ATP-binding protein n=1 Tax=Streptomyces iconiensis TaxID=1384038 RepID=A0ABT6ZXJ3_9ACTN|nr:ABC transporter ATP-binding protein [Streptomyces iconiensis]MDJ1133792.1 ABC transporter ATP-binding protein [Streptomyces iconiensis]